MTNVALGLFMLICMYLFGVLDRKEKNTNSKPKKWLRLRRRDMKYILLNL